MKALVIRPDAAPAIEEIADADGLRAAIGGYLEAIGFLPDSCAYLDEDGKVRGDRAPVVNEFATALCLAIGAIRRDDWIAGTLVVVGSDADDEDCDVPDHVVKTVMAGWEHSRRVKLVIPRPDPERN